MSNDFLRGYSLIQNIKRDGIAGGKPQTTKMATTKTATITTTTKNISGIDMDIDTGTVTDGESMGTFMALLFFYNAMFTNWKDGSPTQQYNVMAKIEGDNDPFATGMGWDEMQEAILKDGDLLQQDLVKLVNKSKNMDDLRNNLLTARREEITAIEKPDWLQCDLGKLKAVHAKFHQKMISVADKFEDMERRCTNVSLRSNGEANPVMNGQEWNTLWENTDDILEVIKNLLNDKVFEKSLICRFLETMIPLVWSVPFPDEKVFSYHMLKANVKPPSDEYYAYQNLFDMYGVMKWFHDVKQKCFENGQVTMRNWFTHFVTEMKKLKQEFKVDMKEILDLFTPSTQAIEIGCAANLYEEEVWANYLKKNPSFSILECMRYVLVEGFEAFYSTLSQESDENQDVKDMFDALYKLFRRGVCTRKKKEVKFSKCSGEGGLADEVLKCCVEVYGNKAVTGTSTYTPETTTTTNVIRTKKIDVCDVTGNGASVKKRKNLKKNNQQGKRRKKVTLANDTLDPWTPFTMIVKDGKYEQKELCGGKFNKYKNMFIIRDSCNSDQRYEYRDPQAGVSAVPNLIPPNKHSSYQMFTGFFVHDDEERRLPKEDSMYIREEDNSSDDDDSGEESSDDEKEDNPYKSDANGVYYWDGEQCFDIDGYFKKDNNDEILTDVLCCTDEDYLSNLKPEDLYDQVEWGKSTLPWKDTFQRTETMMRYKCRSKKPSHGKNYVYVQKDYEEDGFESFDEEGNTINVAIFDDGDILVTEDNCDLYKISDLPENFDKSKYKDDNGNYEFNMYQLVDGSGPQYIVVRQ